MSQIPSLLPDLHQNISTWLTGAPAEPLFHYQNAALGSGALAIALLVVLLITLGAMGAFIIAISKRPVVGPEHALMEEILRADREEHSRPAPTGPAVQPWEKEADWWKKEDSAPD